MVVHYIYSVGRGYFTLQQNRGEFMHPPYLENYWLYANFEIPTLRTGLEP